MLERIPSLVTKGLVLLALSWVGNAARGNATSSSDREAFDAGLQTVRELVERRDWAEARESLLALVDAHEAESWVFAARPEIVQLLERCAFWSAHEEPELESLVSAKVLLYDRYRRKIRLLYTPRTLGDFTRLDEDSEEEQAVYVHPMLIDGKGSLEIRGTMAGLRDIVPLALYESQVGYGAAFNQPKKRFSRTQTEHRLFRFAEQEFTQEDTRKGQRIDDDEEIRVKMATSGGRLSVMYRSARVFSESVPENRGIAFGFAGKSSFEELVLDGDLETSWTDGLVDAAVEESRRRFLESYDPEDELPAWLVKAREDEGDLTTAAPLFPSAPDRRDHEHLARVTALLDAGRHADAVAYVEGRPADHLGPIARTYLRALCLASEEGLGGAEASFADIVARDPDSYVARRSYADALFENNRYEAALVELGRLVERRPDRPESFQSLAIQLLRDGSPDRAEETIRAGLERHPTDETLHEVNALVRKARNGPDWDRVHREESSHYVVTSDLDQKLCRQASRQLESALELYQDELGPVELGGRKFPVFLFSGFAGYERYVADVVQTTGENTAGMYLTLLQQLLIWNVPKLDDMLATIRHEGFHQYVHARARDVPIWLNEGLAEYFETADHGPVGSRFGSVHEGNVARLEERRGAMVSVRHLTRMNQPAFMADAELHYAQSWALVHLLCETTPEHRAAFETLWNGLVAALPWAEAHDAAFSEIGYRELDRRLREHVEELVP